jgi:hypothetical protein
MELVLHRSDRDENSDDNGDINGCMLGSPS